MKRFAILALLACVFAAYTVAGNQARDPFRPTQRLTLSNGFSIHLSAGWAARANLRHVPPEKLADSAPPLTFSEMHIWDNPTDSSVLELAVSNNPFLGLDETALDTQIDGATNSNPALLDYLFYFFFPPPRDCLDDAAAAFRSKSGDADSDSKNAAKSRADFDFSYDCVFLPTLADFYASQLTASLHISRANGATHWRSHVQQFYLASMESVQSNDLTFYVFEAQAESPLSLAVVNHFNLPDNLEGAQADFFWAVGAPTPFPFVRDSTRKNIPLIHVAYAAVGPGPNKRPEFLHILHEIAAPWGSPY
ncbi:MAG TPA: hypothetical protein VGU63_14720 [Candidatus Acidoferrales bacterium]|nr:hypothetical protein [Candidatus Acidoferrales bacterium]